MKKSTFFSSLTTPPWDPSRSHADPSGTTRKSRSGKTDPESTKSRWLDAGDPVVARRAASSNDDGASGRKWETAKIIKVIDEEHYRCEHVVFLRPGEKIYNS